MVEALVNEQVQVIGKGHNFGGSPAIVVETVEEVK